MELRIATVYRDEFFQEFPTVNMATLRWLRVSQALAGMGNTVDIIANLGPESTGFGPGVRVVPFQDVRWDEYHVVKTLYQRGFDTLERHGGGGHPFILSSLATVVGEQDGAPGVQVLPRDRELLWAVQERIAAQSRAVSLRTPGNRALWLETHPGSGEALMVPTGVDRTIPTRQGNPFRSFREPVALYVGNLQRQIPGQLNEMWADRLHEVAAVLKRRGVRLCFVGPSKGVHLDSGLISDFGPVPHEAVWDYKRSATVGIALAEGRIQRNESSKIYNYLRAGLPVVSEEPIPNNTLLTELEMGVLVPYGDPVRLGEAVAAAAYGRWPRRAAAQRMTREHTWGHRVSVYRDLLAQARP